MWDRGQGPGIALFFLTMIAAAVVLCIVITRLIYVIFHFG